MAAEIKWPQTAAEYRRAVEDERAWIGSSMAAEMNELDSSNSQE
jgi:hypothetical protein